jgi:hypothetical protein
MLVYWQASEAEVLTEEVPPVQANMRPFTTPHCARPVA